MLYYIIVLYKRRIKRSQKGDQVIDLCVLFFLGKGYYNKITKGRIL